MRPLLPVTFRYVLMCSCVRNSPPLIQSTLPRTALFVYVTLAVTFMSYARFCYLVINDITEYLGIACFTVRKKDRSGEWVGAAEVNGGKNQ